METYGQKRTRGQETGVNGDFADLSKLNRIMVESDFLLSLNVCIMNSRKAQMDIFFNPNVAYLVLVIGFLIAILALVTPGTGVLELVALGLLFVAGWQMTRLSFNWVALGLLLVGMALFLLAIRMRGRWYGIAASFLAITLGSTFLFVEKGWKPAVDPILAVVVNLLLVGFFWIVFRRGWEAIKSKPLNKLTSTENSIGVSRTRIHKEGSVFLNGEMWSASSKEPIAENKKVKVISRNGYILEVMEIKPPASKQKNS
jgi:membrane-bound ClpP family serine protease